MKISGLQKMTLLDYPGKIAATVFTAGCNFRCPYCHNATLVLNPDAEETISEEEFFDFLSKRKNFLEGVCITGGEPLMQKDLGAFISKIKEMGFFVKLDTNGSFPDKLIELVEGGLIDYVAMDIKNAPGSYASTAGLDPEKSKSVVAAVDRSISYLLTEPTDYEFRTTVVSGYHTKADFTAIGKWIRGAKRYYLQKFVDTGDLIQAGLEGVGNTLLAEFAEEIREDVPSVEIRYD